MLIKPQDISSLIQLMLIYETWIHKELDGWSHTKCYKVQQVQENWTDCVNMVELKYSLHWDHGTGKRR